MIRLFEISLKSCFFLAIVLIASAAMGQNPGTAGDPLVSKSYVEHFLKFRSMVLPADSEIKPESGAMLVVRSGQLRLEAAAGKAVIDLSAGREISGSADIPPNHLILIPENSGIVLKARKLTLIMASFMNEAGKP